jgi:hypothetical protein
MKKSAAQVKSEKSGEKFGIPALAALKRAAKRARATAKMHGTKLYFLRDGKIVAEKP